MITKIAVKALAASALGICSVPLASAQSPHRFHAHSHDHYTHRPLQSFRDMQREAIRADQAKRGIGFGGVPEDPLIPIRDEAPPPVDPNEPASGSYGAMLEGRNPAPSEP